MVESAAGTLPVNVVMPGMTKSNPMPYCLAAEVSASLGISVASLAKVVLQDLANASVAGTVPRSNSKSLRMGRESTIHWPGQSTSVVGVISLRSMAALAVTILNVEPGGYCPVSASGPWASAAAFCATVRISPVLGWMATSTAGS